MLEYRVVLWEITLPLSSLNTLYDYVPRPTTTATTTPNHHLHYPHTNSFHFTIICSLRSPSSASRREWSCAVEIAGVGRAECLWSRKASDAISVPRELDQAQGHVVQHNPLSHLSPPRPHRDQGEAMLGGGTSTRSWGRCVRCLVYMCEAPVLEK